MNLAVELGGNPAQITGTAQEMAELVFHLTVPQIGGRTGLLLTREVHEAIETEAVPAKPEPASRPTRAARPRAGAARTETKGGRNAAPEAHLGRTRMRCWR